MAGEHVYVDERVIVPRSFIRIAAKQYLHPWVSMSTVLDLCTGSDAILAALVLSAAWIWGYLSRCIGGSRTQRT